MENFLSVSTPEEVKEIAAEASIISRETSMQTAETLSRHELQAKQYGREMLACRSFFIRKCENKVVW
ncbi:MAG: hypothetical protein WC208_11895 [Gallionella sp.]|jgi:hypothetical protein